MFLDLILTLTSEVILAYSRVQLWVSAEALKVSLIGLV